MQEKQEKENYLKNAELDVEQNYNMIDGILGNNIPHGVCGG